MTQETEGRSEKDKQAEKGRKTERNAISYNHNFTKQEIERQKKGDENMSMPELKDIMKKHNIEIEKSDNGYVINNGEIKKELSEEEFEKLFNE